MTLWRWAALFSLPFLAISQAFGLIDGLTACSTSTEPILAFELVRSMAEVAALFPPDCRAVAAAAQVKGLWLDNLAFIPVYTGFLVLYLLALGRDRPNLRRLLHAGIAMTALAALADYWENSRLMLILADLPGSKATIDQLVPAPRLKFVLLGVVVILAGFALQANGGWRRFAGLIALAGGAISLFALFGNAQWLHLGALLGWLPLVLTSWIEAFRKRVVRSQPR
ncbi:MAG: hypothetical protein ACKOQ3_02465 [Novosphingobium sp.]